MLIKLITNNYEFKETKARATQYSAAGSVIKLIPVVDFFTQVKSCIILLIHGSSNE